MSRQLIFFLFLFVLEAISTGAQTTIVCQGKTLRIGKKSTIVRSSKECKVCKNYILNDDAIDFVKPPYPDEARAKRISGSVAVQITVNEKGRGRAEINCCWTSIISADRNRSS